jgi:lipoate-protein ligase A
MAWRLINFKNCNAYENMAIDEAIFTETVRNNKPPTIRFYGWEPAAVSIGYFQDIKKEVNLGKCRDAGVDYVRRLTGGKAVFHDDEITYSVVAINGEHTFPPDILGTYKVISECLLRGLADLGIKATLAPLGRITNKTDDFPACCFSIPSRHELLVGERKICGSAQLRSGGGFLQHGSLLKTFDPVTTASLLLPSRSTEQLDILKRTVTAINEEVAIPLSTEEICAALTKGFAFVAGIKIVESVLTEAEEVLKNELIKKYSDPHWNLEGKKHFQKM